MYAQGTNLWHAIERFNGGIWTLCGRRLPLGAEVSDTVIDVFFCGQCRRIQALR